MNSGCKLGKEQLQIAAILLGTKVLFYTTKLAIFDQILIWIIDYAVIKKLNSVMVTASHASERFHIARARK